MGLRPKRKRVSARPIILFRSAPAEQVFVSRRIRCRRSAGVYILFLRSFGSGDLVEALQSEQVKLEDVAAGELPEHMQKMTAEERAKYIEEQLARRTELQARIAKLSIAREAHIAAAKKKLAAEGKGDSFDLKVSQIVREQAARKGIEYAD